MDLTHRLPRVYNRLASCAGLSPLRFTLYWSLILFVLVATLLVRNTSSRDPGSWFFNPNIAYSRQYSAVRQRQALRLIETAADVKPPATETATIPGLCIGIPSIAREGARYLRMTVGSLLAGLTDREREGIKLIVFIPHTDPAIHPAYHEAWLPHLTDQLLLYNLSQHELDYVKSLEREDVEHRTKGLYDYTYLMQACYATKTPYIAIIEDDVVAMDGWYHRSVNGIPQAEAQASSERMSNGFLYLRMFYTEQFLGWNSEYWIVYAFWSITTIGTISLLVHWSRSTFNAVRHALTPRLSLLICLVLAPWMVVLTFAAGRVTVFPLPHGINKMNDFGCCAQGLIFPRHKARDLIEWYKTSRVGFADMLTEQYANEHGEQRWALTPSVLQHIGAKSSKPEDFGHGAKYSKSVAGMIWNFAFELNSPKALRKEHELAAIEPLNLLSGTTGSE
ncbi:hypothetical protein M409DRAFT_30860 [Zasmidium cellare ATCC 36951]|uniref:Uncharacterized protein n=1 Tax=Zasmidium cellare ATCC 36951 TaxID=1080233 RepID=A0A6A6BVC5_ZASCE|nr:uncharacterized protein M409DRAFT_30860 [Zasmidium cellare ATCC 36951]KAF2158635.1 hypothetical protein M409DRAFT_30860 [Zasmidium cellare ATCC 36951]